MSAKSHERFCFFVSLLGAYNVFASPPQGPMLKVLLFALRFAIAFLHWEGPDVELDPIPFSNSALREGQLSHLSRDRAGID
jgi:hypothetical protein